MMNDLLGKGSVCVLQPEENCPKCNQRSVYYLGSSVAHGNPYSAAADTEVEFYFCCKRCDSEWAMYA